jgi:hypothetical protein
LKKSNQSVIYQIELVVKNHLIITDLSYLQETDTGATVKGGSVYVDTATATDLNYAVALAMANAQGEYTITDTDTLARIIYYGNFTLGLANARAMAFARTGNIIERSSSFHDSTSLNFHS